MARVVGYGRGSGGGRAFPGPDRRDGRNDGAGGGGHDRRRMGHAPYNPSLGMLFSHAAAGLLSKPGVRVLRRGEKRPVDISGPVLRGLDSRVLEATACGPIKARKTQPTQEHPAWRRMVTTPRGMVDMMAAPVTTEQCCSGGRQKKVSVQAMGWSREGRRLVTASNEGKYTTWSGIDFSHLQTMHPHESQVNALCWLSDGNSFISGDSEGTMYYFEWTMTLMRKLPHTHNGLPVQSISMAPGYVNHHFCSAGDDKNLRIWDWGMHQEERCLEGHGHRVLSVAWHPCYALLASGSKDNTVKLWDPRADEGASGCVATLHGHKLDVTKVAWNPINGNWLLSASRDHTLRLFDIRSTKEPVSLTAHQKDVYSIAWHPTHERLFASGDFEGSLAFWMAGNSTPETLHKPSSDREKAIYELAWHPLGHVLASGSKDQTVKFWTRRPIGNALVDEGEETLKSAGGDDPASGASATSVPQALKNGPRDGASNPATSQWQEARSGGGRVAGGGSTMTPGYRSAGSAGGGSSEGSSGFSNSRLYRRQQQQQQAPS
mmetsp:Transcript_213/g.694  ORF Transcript_213/g.694 Transcript_213/m.694 type:complete len:546 (-) Transcript_213:8-1645(-)